MASLVLKMSGSLDGYVAPVDGSTDWVAAGGPDDGRRWTVETVSNAGAHLIGAATYTGWAGYWPSASGPFAKPIDEYRLLIHPVVLGAGERIFLAPLTIEPVSTTVFSGGAVAHVFAAHP
jgi:dihydrofolate reductase